MAEYAVAKAIFGFLKKGAMKLASCIVGESEDVGISNYGDNTKGGVIVIDGKHYEADNLTFDHPVTIHFMGSVRIINNNFLGSEAPYNHAGGLEDFLGSTISPLSIDSID